MKTHWPVGLLLAMCLLAVPVSGAGVEIRTVRDFHEPLAPYGQWVEIAPFGPCWSPVNVARDWRPYAFGQWVWTDNGWYWASDEKWAWATYHYGRWMKHPAFRWVWVPDVVWAPAWVAWREGGGYIGWAPLPPECDFDLDTGVIVTTGAELDPLIFVYARTRHFCERLRSSVLVVNNRSLWHRTADVTRIQRHDEAVINHGPSVRLIEREVGNTVAPVRIHIYWPGGVRPPLPPPPRRGPEVKPVLPRPPPQVVYPEPPAPGPPPARPEPAPPKRRMPPAREPEPGPDLPRILPVPEPMPDLDRRDRPEPRPRPDVSEPRERPASGPGAPRPDQLRQDDRPTRGQSQGRQQGQPPASKKAKKGGKQPPQGQQQPGGQQQGPPAQQLPSGGFQSPTNRPGGGPPPRR